MRQTTEEATGTFKCGHSGPVPNHMGRGQARVGRLGLYFDRKCQGCAEINIRELAARLTDTHGEPITQAARDAFARRHVAKLQY